MAARLSLTLTESAVNITNNTSKVTAKLYYYGNGVSYNNNSPSGSITIDGTKYTFSKSFTTSTSAQLLATKEKTVTHNTNGSKTVTVSASFKTGVSLGTLSTSKNITLTNIARATVPTLNKVTIPLNDSDTVTINTPRASSNFTHTLTYAIGSASGTIASGVGTSYSWKPPVSLLNNITTSTSGTITITCKTYNGSDLIGAKTVNLTATVPDNIKPSFTSIAVSEGNTTVTNAFGNRYIQNLSKPKFTISAAGVNGSSITNNKVTIENETVSSNSASATLQTTIALKNTGTTTATLTTTDSRGRTVTTTRDINVLPYNEPAITGLSYQLTSDTTIRVNVQGKVSSVDGQNTKTLVVKYKKASETSWQTKTVSLSDWEFDVPVDLTGIDNSSSYNIQAVLTDKIKSVDRTTTTGTIVISRKAGGTGVTLFEEATEDGFVVGGGKPARFSGDVTFANHKELYGTFTDGTMGQMLGLNSSDSIILGYGSHANSIGKTDIYGNSITVSSRTAGLSNREYGKGIVLWSGSSYMTDTQTATLSQAVSAQPNGIVLMFSRYTSGTVHNYNWNHFFVSKEFVARHNATGCTFFMLSDSTLSVACAKYLYVGNTSISGVAANNNTGTASGISYKNNQFVMRYVIGI